MLGIHEELIGHLQDGDEQYDNEWMEEINFEVDDYCSHVNDYSISRKNDNMSKASIVLLVSILKDLSMMKV